MSDVEVSIMAGTPQNYAVGIDDQSAAAATYTSPPYPQHLPFFPLFMKKGDTNLNILLGTSRTRMYDDASFDELGIYATHQTPYANAANAAGNSGAYLRLKPTDAGPRANLILGVDVLVDNLDLYATNSDGSYQLDSITRQPIVKTAGAIVNGIKIRWYLESITDASVFDDTYGTATRGVGTMVSASGASSTKYPLVQMAVPTFGAYGNNVGISLWAPQDGSQLPLNRNIMNKAGAYPYRMAFMTRDNATYTPTPIASTFSEQSIEFTFKPNTLVPNSTKPLSLREAIIYSYEDTADTTLPDWPSPMTDVKVYDANVAAVYALAFNAEKPYANEFSDITTASPDTDMWLMNILTGLSGSGVPYTGVHVVGTNASLPTNQQGLNLVKSNNLWASGGSDGTMSTEMYENLVVEAIARFADANDEFSSVLLHPVSDFYDSGFAMENKRKLALFAATRKDTMINLSTHVAGEAPVGASERSSRAVLLKSYLEAYPESDYFGTANCRATIFAGSGVRLNSVWASKGGNIARTPLNRWLIEAASAYMGAESQKWKSAKAFDQGDNRIISTFKNFDVRFSGATVRHTDWSNGLVYPEPYDTKRLFYAGLQTPYGDDTSVLNGYFFVRACMFLEKIGFEAWREVTSNQKLTAAEIESNIKKYIEDRVIGLFDDRYTITATVTHTALDKQRGYSFHTQVTIAGPNMTTVQTYWLTAQRLADTTTTTTN